jgi:integrase
MTTDRTKYMDAEEVRVLRTVSEARAVLDGQAGRKTGVVLWAIVDTALCTGLRVSELALLRISDFDPKRSSLLVWRNKRRTPIQETLALPDNLVSHLAGYIKWKSLVGQSTNAESPLFVSKAGTGFTTRGLQHAWKAALKYAGLPASLSIHSARHTLAVHLLKKTGNLRQVQKQLGHRSPVTTANMYADISFEDMQAGISSVYDTPD